MKERAILLMNLGSPDSYEVSDVRTYLKEFLMDERVIDIPQFPRSLLVKGIIVPFRAPKSAAKYKTIWTENGSPLIHITNQLAEAVRETTNLPVEVCMRYAHPTPTEALNNLKTNYPNLKEVVLFPLYPHYAMSSYETAVEHVKEAYHKGNYPFELRIIEPYYKNESYINALAESFKPYIQNGYDHLLFSYHGVPERHIKKGDVTGNHCLCSESCCQTPSEAHQYCYRHQVITTTELVAKKLGLEKDKYSFSFQSRLGQDKWLKPFTAAQLAAFPKQGIKNLLVACPAFTSDCLETLEEINEEGQEIFKEAGGEQFTMIPCLNTNAQWVETVGELVGE